MREKGVNHDMEEEICVLMYKIQRNPDKNPLSYINNESVTDINLNLLKVKLITEL